MVPKTKRHSGKQGFPRNHDGLVNCRTLKKRGDSGLAIIPKPIGSMGLVFLPTFTINWVVPPPSNSDHQEYYMFSRDPYKPSFATVTGRGDNPNHQNQPNVSKYTIHGSHGKQPLSSHIYFFFTNCHLADLSFQIIQKYHQNLGMTMLSKKERNGMYSWCSSTLV